MNINKKAVFNVLMAIVCSVFALHAYAAPPTFTAAFSDTTIGPGNYTTLTFTIDNSAESTGVSSLEFSNTLPGGVVIANTPRASTDCSNGSFSATAGASSITFSGYRLGLGQSCTFVLDVTSTTPGAHVNTTGTLSTSAGSAGTATATLTIDASRPGMSMAFSPSAITPGSVSTLTYTIDNSLNGSTANFLTFSDTLPDGVVVSDDPASATTCSGGLGSPTVTASPDGTTIALAIGSVIAGNSCTVSVNVTAADNGIYHHTSGVLSQNGSNPSGTATATLTVSQPFLNAFFPNAVSPGTSVTLSYTLSNFDRSDTATGITFTSDLNAALSGLSATVLPANDFCGSGSTLTGSTTITIAGASLAPEASCSFELTVLIPANAAAGTYANSTSIINYTLGSATTEAAVSTNLVVKKAPTLSMTFIDDPVTPGDNVTARFVLTNTDADNAASAIAFTQRVDDVYTGVTIGTVPNANSCGVGSTFTSGQDISGTYTEFNVEGASLVAGGSCTFDAILTLPADGPTGSFLWTSTFITATVSATAVVGTPAQDTLYVSGAPSLTLNIDEASAIPGSTVTANFALEHSESALADTTGIGFTLALPSGFSAATLPSDDMCGSGSALTADVSGGITTLTFAGGTLSSSADCSFAATLQVASAVTPATYTFTSSTVSATTSSLSVSSDGGSDTLVISGLSMTKSFIPSAALAGDLVTLRYTISNAASASAATDISFTDRMSTVLSGLSASSLPSTPCNGSSVMTGSTSLTFAAGELLPGTSCTFDVTVAVPGGASTGIYSSASSDISATVSSANTSASGATAVLTIESLETSITTTSTDPALSSPIPFAINFSRAITGFVVSDLTVTNGVAGNFLGSDQSFTVDITPSATGTVTVAMAANVVDDAIDPTVQNTATSLSLAYELPPTHVAVTSPATADTNTGASYTISGTHSIDGSNVYLFADSDNDGEADNSTILASAVSSSNAWSLTATLAFQVANNYVVVWEDRVNNVDRAVDVPTITETTPDVDPVISGSPATTVAEDASYSFTPTASDANTNQTISFSIVNRPTWASFSTSTGALTGTPANADVGTTSNIVITVTDSSSASASLSAFNLTVTNTNDAPAISGTPSTTIAEDSAYSFTPSVSDVDVGDSQTFSITNQPSWASFSTLTGALTGTPTNSDIGTTSNIVITITDSASAADSLAAFNLTVSNTNDAPVISGTPSTSVNEDASYSFTPSVSDVDSGDSETFSITNQPSWASFSTSTGALTGTPTNSDVGTTSNVVITVTDGNSAADSLAAFNLTVNNTNDAPVISGSPSTSVNEDASYSFTPSVSDVDSGDSQTFSITNQPSWASFSTTTGALTGTPTNSDVGVTSNIVITITDSASAADSLAAFNLTVSNTNDAPVISGTPSTSVNEDASYSFTPSVSDVDSGDSQIFSIANQPSWASFSSSTGALTGTPSNSDVGTTSAIVITVTDGSSAADSLAAFNLTVNNTNDAPAISGTPSASVNEDASYSFTPSVSDVDSGDSQTFSITNQPSWASFSTSTGALTGTPTNSDVGTTSNIVITVTDGSSAADSLAAFNLTVNNTNDAPVISGTPSTSVDQDVAYSFTPSVSDVDSGDSQTFSVVNQPSWASFSASTGELAGTPTNSDVGTTSNIVITVTDTASATDSLVAFNLTVNNVNDAPVISGTPAIRVVQDTSYSFVPVASDVDIGDSITFSIANQPSWASFSAVTGGLSGTPSNGDIGATTGVVISVTDTNGATTNLSAFDLTVVNSNDAPIISGAPTTSVNEDASYSFIPTASDIDVGDTLTFSIANQPSWANFDDATGALTGTPANDSVGSTSGIVISVRDGAHASASLSAFSVTVVNTNDAPVIGGTPDTSVSENASYSFTPTMNDVDVGDSHTFSIVNMPSWASFNTATGALTGTPTNANVGTTGGIVITVTDASDASASLAAFNLAVGNVNDRPTISGTPDTQIDEDAEYSFTPNATDIDSGDTLIFSIVNMPDWATFDTVTGALTGTPTNDDVGSTAEIVITVTDVAEASASLTEFTLTVNNTNDAPVISGTPSIANEDIPYSFIPVMTDVDVGDTQTFSIANQPSWASFDTTTGALTGTPSNNDIGMVTGIVITVTDASSATDSVSFDLIIVNTNDAPIITGTPATSVDEDAAYSFIAMASDIDVGDTFSFSIINSPSWASFDESTGALTGTPTNADVGTSEGVVISVTDSVGATTSLSAFNLSVNNTNDAPVISGAPNTMIAEDSAYSFVPNMTDVDVGDSQIFSIINAPSWASFNTLTGALTGTPTNADIGTTGGIVITVTDGNLASASLTAFSLTVSNTNDSPVISGTPSTDISEDAHYRFIPVATDEDSADTFLFTITNRPAWATFNSATGELSGTPSNEDVGTTSGIIITVSDSANASASLAAFTLSVNNTNDAPVISGTPNTVAAEDSAYSFVPNITDVDVGDSQAFSIINAPSWASFNALTGALTGTPENADIGTTSGIVITVTDGSLASASLAAFSLTVTNVNDSPVISGTPSTEVDEDTYYRFIPVATDEDGDNTFSFTITNRPAWATFNSATGELSGTPLNEDVGTTNGIIITVADGANASASLAAFNLSVNNVNDAPEAEDDVFILSFNESGYVLDVLQNDTDIDQDTLTIVSAKSPLGTVTIERGLLRFMSDIEFESVQFEYLVSDGAGGRDMATVVLDIDLTENGPVGRPIVTAPDDVVVNATGIYTRVDLGVATATDAQGYTLPVEVLHQQALFTSGVHQVYWQATDSNNLMTVQTQEVQVNPLVSFTKSQVVVEGAEVSVKVMLSGEPPSYPVIVPYDITGTADEGDHSLVSGELTLTSLEGNIDFTIFEDGVLEESETVVVTLTGDINQGSQNTHTVEIVDFNVSPIVALTASQNGEQRVLVDQQGGIVTVTAQVSDVNPSDTHTFSWHLQDGRTSNLAIEQHQFSFDPIDFVPGHYQLTVTVMDNGEPIQEVINSIYLELVESLPVLTGDDSDGDLVPDELEGLADDDGDGIANYLDAVDACNLLPSENSAQDKFLLEVSSGVCLRRDSINSTGENGAGSLSEEDIGVLAPDEAVTKVGGVFSFTVYGLPTVGQSSSIVLPQQEAIPANAIYRKYIQGEWVDFTVDEHNAVFSAPGEPGYCPEPESEFWVAGLSEGHWCVQLTIEDGGPNDDDGLTNGTIVDPGGVAVILSDNHFPVVSDDTTQTSPDTAIDVNVLENDVDEDNDIVIVSSATATIGQVTITDDGNLRYTPPTGFIGTDVITYSITDGNGGTDSGTLTIDTVAQDTVGATDANPPRRSSGSGAFDWGMLLLLALLLGFQQYARIHLKARTR